MRKSILVPDSYEDIRRELAHRRNMLYLKSAGWCAGVLFLEYLYLWEYFDTRIGGIGCAMIAVVLLLFYPVRVGVVAALCDRGWEGTVRDVKKRSYIHFKNLTNRFYTDMTTRIEGHLIMYGKEGRSAFLEKRFPIKHKFLLQSGASELPYLPGDHVRRYRGCTYPVIVHRAGEDRYPPRVCVFCGKTESDRERSVCDFCGFSLITPEETVRYVEYGM